MEKMTGIVLAMLLTLFLAGPAHAQIGDYDPGGITPPWNPNGTIRETKIWNEGASQRFIEDWKRMERDRETRRMRDEIREIQFQRELERIRQYR